MRLKIRAFLVVIFIYSSLALAGSSFSAIPIPDMPKNYVVDLAGIIDEDAERGLNRYLAELEQKTTAQVVVLTILSLEGRSLEDFSMETAHQRWKLGQKGKDNGVLILVALKERKYRLEIGYGLESILPDSLVGSIGRDYLVPYFKKGDYSNGIFAATLAVTNKIASDAGVTITGMPELRSRPVHKKPGILQSIFTIFFFIAMAILFVRHPFLFLLFMGAGRRGWGGGGGFGGGSGGFGGGGGGGFGGGGASGGW